jgi:hypothetical protein
MNRTLIAVAIVFILGHSAESQSAIKGESPIPKVQRSPKLVC